MGTVPTSFFYGLWESMRLIEQEEGLDEVVARHHRLAEAARRGRARLGRQRRAAALLPQPGAILRQRHRGADAGGHDAEAVRRTALDRFNVSMGGGLGRLGGKVFRIGHLGDLNEPMILGTLASVEMSLRLNGVPHGKGGVEAAMDWLAAA